MRPGERPGWRGGAPKRGSGSVAGRRGPMRNLLTAAVAGILLASCAANPRIVHDKSGSTTSLENLKGRAVVLTFWADYCKPCLQQMPLVLDSVAAHGDQVIFLPVFAQ